MANSDIEKRTQYGTLGFLPLEIRQIIWDCLLRPAKDSSRLDSDASMESLSLQIYDIKTPDRVTRVRSVDMMVIQQLRRASKTLSDEIDHYFVSTRDFYFWSPSRLEACFKSDFAGLLRRITIAASMWEEDQRKDVRQAFNYIPSSLQFMTLKLGPLTEHSFRRQLCTLEMLVNKTARLAPHASICFCKDKWFNQISLDQQAQLEATLKDVER